MSLHPLHRAWRWLPAGPRRRAVDAAIAAVAPRPDRPAPAARHGVVVAGELDRASGLGEGGRLMLAGLRSLGVPAVAAGGLLPDGAPLVVHAAGPQTPLALLRLGRAAVRGRRVIGYWAWELPVLPPSWRAAGAFVHELWVPSRFTAAAMEPWFPGRVRVVPHPVACDPPVAVRADRAAHGLPADAVVTVVQFNLASSFVRKNPLDAVAAHHAAFGDRADRVLLFRVLNPGDFPDDLATLRAALRPNMRIDTRTLARDENHALMAACDIVLSLHRSEGFGLVLAEAMLLGLPVVATDWSGNTDFMDASCAMMVPARLVAAVDPRGVYDMAGALWAAPDVAAAAAQLRHLADDPSLRHMLGRAGWAAARVRLGADGLSAAVRALGL